jgi:asparagine synthase (glutamine-hydrolysing)
VPVYYCAKLAKEHGLNVLLAGDGGDELFGGNQRYADQYVFSLYDRVPQALRALMLEPLSQIPGGEKVLPLRKLRSYIAQAVTPMPARLETYNLFQRFGAENIFERDFLSATDAHHPASLQYETYHAARASSLINRMLALDWKFTLADNDLRKVGRMCGVAGIEARYPLLDDDLVDFSLRLPSDYKLRGRRLRYFFKRALSDFLPRETLAKKKHGFGLPFGLWARDHRALRELTYDTLTALKRRHIIRATFIERLMHGHRDEHPSFYGGHIWVLVMLEQWLQAHADIGLSASRARMTRAA